MNMSVHTALFSGFSQSTLLFGTHLHFCLRFCLHRCISFTFCTVCIICTILPPFFISLYPLFYMVPTAHSVTLYMSIHTASCLSYI